jgi:hypothetical protein
MKATFIIASLFAALVAAAPAAVDTRSESAIEIEARQVRTKRPLLAPVPSDYCLVGYRMGSC